MARLKLLTDAELAEQVRKLAKKYSYEKHPVLPIVPSEEDFRRAQKYFGDLELDMRRRSK